ncbi:MAG: 16S rRNA (cytosine(967)-C(5))-methyltransferase RsmB [Pseudomonadota bacterium]
MSEAAIQTDSEGLQSREAAYKILCDVLLKNTPLDQIIATHPKISELEQRDRNLVRMIIMTALRHKGQMDDIIKRARDGKNDLNPEKIRILLYVGLTQLLFMGVPDHAAVDTTVQLAEQEGLMRQKGLVNAILRRAGREGKLWLSKQDPVQTNIPSYLLSAWVNDYGLSVAADIAKASLKEAAMDITVKNPNDLNEIAGNLSAQRLPINSLRLTSAGDVTRLDGFEKGTWWVQDSSASLPAKLLGDGLSGQHIVDLCAAPGGKTAQLAAAGAKVTAVDRSAKRLKRLDENMQRLGLSQNVETVIADGASWQPPQPVDMVLLDAPCSATGTIRRHPDVMHLKSDIDINRLAALQENLLNNMPSILKSSGMLIYCTCSLQKKEGEEQIQKFLNKNPNFQTVPVKTEEVGDLEVAITPEGWVRILPQFMGDEGGMDGFFIARLKKT